MTRNSNFRRFHESLKKMHVKKILKDCGNKISKLFLNDQKYLSKISNKISKGLYDTEKVDQKKSNISIQEQRSNINLKESINE